MLARRSAPYLLSSVALWGTLLVAAFVFGGAWPVVAAVDTALLGFLVYFFRDPERAVGDGVVSPADGRVLAADGEKLVIFMSPLDVHVNRAPVEGRLVRAEYRHGSHLPAFKKESERNERLDLTFEAPAGRFDVALIAGTVARRIHPYLTPGAQVKKGDRLGLIAFGSRCELRLPSTRSEWKVRPGDRVRAGETTVAS